MQGLFMDPGCKSFPYDLDSVAYILWDRLLDKLSCPSRLLLPRSCCLFLLSNSLLLT